MEIVNIGVDIGGTTIKAGIVTKNGEILTKNVYKTFNSNPELILDNLEKQISELLEYAKNNNLKVNGVGFGVPGIVNNVNGSVVYACNLDVENFDLKGGLNKRGINLEISLSNDANVACLAEQKFGAAKGKDNVVMITLGTGVGGGVVIDGKLFEGFEGKGAELGHHVIVIDGEPCGCGRRGCLEAYASATALIRITKEHMMKDKSSKMWEFCNNNLENVNGLTSFECEKLGDKEAKEVVDEYVKYLGEGILNFCNIFRPNVIVLGGGVANQKENLTSRLIKYCKDRNYGYKNTPAVDIVIATLGNDAGIIGAAHLLGF